MSASYDKLIKDLLKAYKHHAKGRFILGITGIPGAGKSTLAASLAEKLNNQLNQEIAIVVPMDGFHLKNAVLQERGLLAKKGAPETFDAAGFAALLKTIAADKEKIFCPAYDRKLHDPVSNAILVESRHRIIIIEGNYLLLDAAPWQELKNYLTQTWFIDISLEIAKERLIKRHTVSGRSLEEALKKVTAVDLPNARLIQKTKSSANKIVKLS